MTQRGGECNLTGYKWFSVFRKPAFDVITSWQ